MHRTIHFSSGSTDYHFNGSFTMIDALAKERSVVIVTDSHLFKHYQQKLDRYKTIVIPAGETHKSWEMVKQIAEGLIKYEVDKSHILIGVGGGVVTDITGFVASTYMRGLSFGFVPTSVLGMVDAAIGGKNGVNLGVYKNSLGTIRQPEFIVFDTDFLRTLPDAEWSNGFAEIIKYGCIFDSGLLEELHQHDLDFYKADRSALQAIIEKAVTYKNKTVQEDEYEKSIRKLLNFGHTVGHAIENYYSLSHGKAIAIGMMVALKLSEQYCGFSQQSTAKIRSILEHYQLPVSLKIDVNKILAIIKLDKKRNGEVIDFILLNKPGNAIIRKTAFSEIEDVLLKF